MTRIRLAGLLTFCLGAALLATPARAVDPKLLPNDTEIVFTFNFQQLLKSELVNSKKEWLEKAQEAVRGKLAEKDAEKYLRQAGLDPLKDIHTLTVASPGSIDPDSWLMFVEGKFDWSKLKSAITSAAKDAGKDVKVINIGDLEAFEINADGEKTVFAGLAGQNALAVGAKKSAIQDANGRVSGTKSSALKAEFNKLAKNISSKQTASFAATSAAILRMIENLPIPNDQVANFFQKLDGIYGSVTVEKNIGLHLGAFAKDAESAAGLAQMINGGLGFAKAMIKQKAEADPKANLALDVINTMRVTQQGANVTVRGEITYATLMEILKNLPRKNF